MSQKSARSLKVSGVSAYPPKSRRQPSVEPHRMPSLTQPILGPSNSPRSSKPFMSDGDTTKLLPPSCMPLWKTVTLHSCVRHTDAITSSTGCGVSSTTVAQGLSHSRRKSVETTVRSQVKVEAGPLEGLLGHARLSHSRKRSVERTVRS